MLLHHGDQYLLRQRKDGLFEFSTEGEGNLNQMRDLCQQCCILADFAADGLRQCCNLIPNQLPARVDVQHNP